MAEKPDGLLHSASACRIEIAQVEGEKASG
jgi:hypothetical protein